MSHDFDILITGARIVDGTGNPWHWGDIGLKGGRIAAMGHRVAGRAARVIKADGLVACPGFIDAHAHDDFYLLAKPAAPAKVVQGVTTTVTGHCGLSAGPAGEGHRAELIDLLGLLGAAHVPEEALGPARLGRFLDSMEAAGPGINVVPLVGHTTIRLAVMGADQRDPEPGELEAMADLVRQSLADGAFGLSTGLIYPPGVYARTPELIALARAAAEAGGFYSSHIRNETADVLPAMEEALTIGREAGCRVLISHHKVVGRSNWGRSVETLALIGQARREGQEVYFDQYPYAASSTYLSIILPPSAHQGGPEALCRRLGEPGFRAEARRLIESGEPGWESLVPEIGFERIVIATSPTRPDLAGRSLANIAAAAGQDPLEAAFDLIRDDLAGTGAIYHGMDEADVERIMACPLGMVGSDGMPAFAPKDRVHPRFYGSFPRVLGRYVRERGVIGLEEAVRKMTSLPAQVLGLAGKGLLRPGLDADLVLLDPDEVIDRADYGSDPAPPLGLPFVFVGGRVAVEGGRVTGQGRGRVLRLGQP